MDLTINTGTITPTASNHRVDTQGAAATDTLAVITAAPNGTILFLRTVSSARDVTIAHGAGNIFAAVGDVVLSTQSDFVTLICDGTNWFVTSEIT